MWPVKDQWDINPKIESVSWSASHYICSSHTACFVIAILPVCYLQITKSPNIVTVLLHFPTLFFFSFQHCILLRSTGQSGSEETALVIIHLSIFSHVLLHYSHPSIYTAIRVCHSNELQLASPVITTGAVLPFLTAVSCHAKLTLITGKVPCKCQRVSHHSWPSPYVFCILMDERGEMTRQ